LKLKHLLKSDRKAPKLFNTRLQDSTTMSKKLLALGVILVIAGFVLPEIPVSGNIGFISWTYTLRELDNICKSPGGAIGKAFYPPLQSECSKAGLAVLFSQILIIIGVVILAVGLIKMARSPKTEPNQTQKP
jgi:uncharacterized membrane protein